LPFGLPQVLAIMTALAAFNPNAAATMQFINTELLDELAQGTPLGEAMVNVSVLLSSSSGEGPASPLAPLLNQIGPMFALAPTVIAGGVTVLGAIPEAVIPVIGAVVVAAFNVASAVGSDGLAAAVQAGLSSVMTAAAKGIATMVNVVESVLQNIAALVVPASAAAVRTQASTVTSKTAAPTSRATGSATNATGVAGPRPRHLASASTPTSSGRSTSAGQASTKRVASPTGTKGTAKSGR
jgi:hypothetical protein